MQLFIHTCSHTCIVALVYLWLKSSILSRTLFVHSCIYVITFRAPANCRTVALSHEICSDCREITRGIYILHTVHAVCVINMSTPSQRRACSTLDKWNTLSHSVIAHPPGPHGMSRVCMRHNIFPVPPNVRASSAAVMSTSPSKVRRELCWRSSIKRVQMKTLNFVRRLVHRWDVSGGIDIHLNRSVLYDTNMWTGCLTIWDNFP